MDSDGWNMKSIVVGIMIGVVGIAAALFITGVPSENGYQVKSNMGFKLEKDNGRALGSPAAYSYLESYALKTCLPGKNCALSEATKYCVQQACAGSYNPTLCAQKVSYSCGGPFIR